jgi:formyl-CoA transferase
MGNQNSVTGPLEGLNVLELSNVIAGPFAASLLADYGANVIKVELPGVGDSFRRFGPFHAGEPLRWATMSRNKKCITLDLRNPKGLDIAKQLVQRTDLVIENFRPGILDKWGLTYDVMREVNKRIVVLRISGYGQSGPYREKAGFGMAATAFSGYTYTLGYSDRPPTSPPISLADYLAGYMGAVASLAALMYMKNNPEEEGQEIDLALYEPLFRIMEGTLHNYTFNGVVQERGESVSSSVSPVGVFLTKDKKWVTIVASTDRTFDRLAECIGRQDMLTDPRFNTNSERVKHNEETLQAVQDWCDGLARSEIITRLDKAGVPASPVNSIADIVEEPHFIARENIVEVEHPQLGSFKMPAILPKFSKTPGKIRFPGPSLGEHNREIYCGMLGMKPEEFETLRQEGVI